MKEVIVYLEENLIRESLFSIQIFFVNHLLENTKKTFLDFKMTLKKNYLRWSLIKNKKYFSKKEFKYLFLLIILNNLFINQQLKNQTLKKNLQN